MAPRSAFVVVLIWGLVGSTDAAQVARDKNPQALRKKSIPMEDQNTLLDATLLSALTPFDSSKGKPGDNRQIKSLLRMASGTDRLDPDAFDALFETLRTSTKTTLNTSVEGIESDYNGHVAAITACETNHGFHGAPANARRIAYDAAVQSYENATQVAEQKCSTQTSNCNGLRTKAMALHNYVQTEIVNTYGCNQTSVQCPPTVFGLTDFYLKNTDNVAAEVKAKHSAWKTAAGMCSAATGECDNANVDAEEKCADVDGVAVNGRNAYDQCYGNHQGLVSGFDVDAQIANQKTVVKNLEKVLCIIKVAVDSHGDTPKRDNAITCTDLGVDLSPAGGAIEYKCVCTSPSSSPPEIYSETYVTQLTLDPVPNRDTAWDPLGCKELTEGKAKQGAEVAVKDEAIKLKANPAFCLNLHGFAQSNGSAINLWTCNGHDSQKWIYDGSQVKLRANPAFCLNLHRFARSNGAAINLWTCNGHDSQKWEYNGGELKLMANPAFCLNLHRFAQSNGAAINLWTCNGHDSQEWELQRMDALM